MRIRLTFLFLPKPVPAQEKTGTGLSLLSRFLRPVAMLCIAFLDQLRGDIPFTDKRALLRIVREWQLQAFVMAPYSFSATSKKSHCPSAR